MKDYLLRLRHEKEEYVEKYDEIISKINTNLINKFNPSITSHEWMNNDIVNKEQYFEDIKKTDEYSNGKLRDLLNEFDETVNPFISQKELLSMNEVFKNVNLTIDSYTLEDNIKREQCGSLTVGEINSKSKLINARTLDGIHYRLVYYLNEADYVDVMHYYIPGEDCCETGEFIRFYSNIDGKKENLRYNLTRKILITNGKVATMLDFEYENVCRQLSYAIELASNISSKVVKTKKDEKVRKME